MTSLISIYIGGSLTILMALFHTQFFKLFKWKAEFRNVTELNKKIFYTIHFALLLLFLGIGLLSLIYAKELSNSKGISLGLNIVLSAFWLWRTFWQVIYFNGKIMHYTLIVIFTLLFITYLFPVLQG